MARPRRPADAAGPGWTAPLIALLILGGVIAAGFGLPFATGSPAAEAMVTVDSVNLRAGPGTSYDILAVLPAGTSVSVHEDHRADFTAVSVNGQRGWVASRYLIAPADVESQPTIMPTRPAPEPTTVPTPTPTAATVLAQAEQVEDVPQPGEHWIEVNRTTRTVTLHDGEIVVAEFDVLIGKDPAPDGYYSTAVGTFHVYVMEKNLAETPFADGVYLTDFVGFDPDRSNGFHSPVRDADGNVVITGGTQTLGCVRLSEEDAQTLFAFASLGMRVEIHD